MSKPIVATITSEDGSADNQRLRKLAELLSDDELDVIPPEDWEVLDAEANEEDSL